MNRPAPQHRLRILAATGAAGLGLLFAAPSFASHVGDSQTLDQQLIGTNNQLLAALAQWEKSPAGLRPALAAQLTQLAQHRQEHMILLLQKTPSVAAARMMPASLRAKLPAAAASYVEQEVHVRGVALAHVSDNFATGQSRSVFKLQGEAGGKALTIHLADPSGSDRDLHRMAGKQAAIDAMRIGDHLVILDKKRVQLQAAGSTSTGGTVVAAGTVVQGNQNTLSILVNFSDKALPSTCTTADVENRVFGSSGATVNNNYRESSRGLVSFSGKAVGPFPINFTSTGACDYTGWALAADAAAKAAGFDPALYQRVNYVTPANSTCGWSGLAYMPGKQSWVQSCGSTGVFSHELGHNLSLHHAATPSAEYGDASDPMGGARMVGHNGANRTMAGWMPAGSVLDVGSGGSYALASVSTNTTATSPQVIRIAKPDTQEFYYLSLRQALNLDVNLGSTFLDTVSVHRASGSLPTRTYLLQNLASGQAFNDTANGISVINRGVANGTAALDIVFAGGGCVRTAPAVSVAPASQTAAPGSTVTYSLTVKNQNNVYCGNSTFNLTQVLPSGFSGGFAASSLALAPGASASTNWSVNSSAQVASGTYAFDASATDASFGNTATAHATEIVYVDSTPPTVNITSPAAGASVSGRVNLSATASDGNGVQAVEFHVDGQMLARDTAAPYGATWNARKALAGKHVLLVRAIDAAGNKAEQSIDVFVK